MRAIITLFLSLFYVSFYCQSKTDILQEIQTLDAEFWKSYNSCSTKNMTKYVCNDIEFYHDKGGITLGKKNLINSIKTNLCSNKNYKIRKELIKGTEHFSILYEQGTPYGLLHSGEHLFLLTINNNKEYADGKAKFVHLWLLENNQWKMKRIYSYDHQSIQ